jgi:REP element-mobilizing transposase RayT
MPFHADRPPRRSIRLQDYDYTQQGAYFVTICTYHRDCWFGEIVGGGVILTQIGAIADECWQTIPDHFPGVELDAYIVMPNHLHGIVIITQRDLNVGATHGSPLRAANNPPLQPAKGLQPGSLGAIIGQFKSSVSRRLKAVPDAPIPLWQRNYYEHIIRDEDDLNRIRAYIENNASTWETDHENPNGIGGM